MPQQTIIASIRTFISGNFPAVRKRKLEDTDPLLQSGIIDSMGILDLVGHLETTFDISVDDDDPVPENFDSIETIAAFVEKKQNQHQSV
jgi:acyl carrier protein